MILGYLCEGCKAVVDEVTKCVILNSDKSAPLITQWRCEDCCSTFISDFTDLDFTEDFLQITEEKKSANVMKLLDKPHISRMGRR